MRQESTPPPQSFTSNPIAAVVAGLLVAGLLTLIFQHWMHVWIWLPYALFLACPLMMFFMMRGMNGPKA